MVIDVEGQLQEGYKMTDTAELIARSCPTCGYQIDRVERLTNTVAAQAQEIERLQSALGCLTASEVNTERCAFTEGLNECRRQYKPQIEALEKRAEAAEAKVAEQAQEIERFKTALTATRNRIEDDAQTIDRHVAKIGKLQNALIGRE
jgi:uncharacterized coiled-coil protein SlyX